MFGSHLSIAGGLVNALQEARTLKMDCVQVFTKNQRQWRVRPLKDADRSAWLDALHELGWEIRGDRHRTVSHNSYLINLASPDPTSWERSIAAQRVELERCESLGIGLLVAHPGAHRGPARPAGQRHDLGTEPTTHEIAGLDRIVAALDRIHADLPGYRTITCLETTTGSGSNLGYDFGQLRYILNRVAEPHRVGLCFDTCHVTAAGYDMSTETSALAVLSLWDEVCGLGNLRVLHVNDSIGAAGSRIDRHAHIGMGSCGLACFRVIVNHNLLTGVPKILETPKGRNSRGVPWDVLNVRRLRRLMVGPQKPGEPGETAEPGVKGAKASKRLAAILARRR